MGPARGQPEIVRFVFQNVVENPSETDPPRVTRGSAVRAAPPSFRLAPEPAAYAQPAINRVRAVIW